MSGNFNSTEREPGFCRSPLLQFDTAAFEEFQDTLLDPLAKRGDRDQRGNPEDALGRPFKSRVSVS